MRKRLLAFGGLSALALFVPLAGTAMAQEVEEVATAVDKV